MVRVRYTALTPVTGKPRRRRRRRKGIYCTVCGKEILPYQRGVESSGGGFHHATHARDVRSADASESRGERA